MVVPFDLFHSIILSFKTLFFNIQNSIWLTVQKFICNGRCLSGSDEKLGPKDHSRRILISGVTSRKDLNRFSLFGRHRPGLNQIKITQ
jgi:hypothetical protein